MKTLTIFIYGISVALLLVGVVMSIFMRMMFGNALIFLTLGLLVIYQGWVISRLSKKLEEKEN